MRAKCPHCENGCTAPNCVDGYLQVKFATGDWFTAKCINTTDCGFENGGHCFESVPDTSSGPCVMCGGPTQWVHVDDLGESTHEKNRDRLAVLRLTKYCRDVQEYNQKLRNMIRGWEEIKSKQLTIEECRMLQICSVCREPSEPTPDKGSFIFSTWCHDKCREKI